MRSFCFYLTFGAAAAAIICLIPQLARAQASDGAAYTSLYSFDVAGGGNAGCRAALVQGSDGNFYGTTVFGGANGVGEVFEITPTGTVTTLYSFATGSNSGNGVYPSSALVQGSDGSFYGTTQEGGAHNAGTVFKITLSGTETVLYSFGSSTNDGANSIAALVQGSDGNFYGTTSDGGMNNNGTVFKITPLGIETTLYSFGSSSSGDGTQCESALVQGSDGNFYGTTVFGGANGTGTVFKIIPSGIETTLYSFGNGSGMSSYAAHITQGYDGNFYGTTEQGGANGDGTVFKINPLGMETTLYSFGNGSGDGADCYGGLVQGSDGNFYGTTVHGGTRGAGTVFKITPSGTETVLYSFTPGSGDGASPIAALVQGSDGNFYGTTYAGGVYGDGGTVFKITPPGSAVRFDFNADGHADLLWYNTGSGDVSIWNMNDQNVLAYNRSFATVLPSSGWLPVASTDVNGDGWPDLMWWNTATGEMSFWTLANISVVQYGADFATVADTDWRPVAIADVNGTSYSIVFQNTATGDISRWIMQGESVTQYGSILASLGQNSPWQVVGAPDLDGDGKSDLLFWNSSTGEVSYWGCDLTGSQILSYNGDFAQVSDTDWHLVGSEDTNSDGHSDLVWWNASTGQVSRWLMDGTTIEQVGGSLAQVNDTTWLPTAIR